MGPRSEKGVFADRSDRSGRTGGADQAEQADQASQADHADLRRRQLGEALNSIRGADSRRLLREVAELSMHGGALVLDTALTARYGKKTGTAFAGIVAGPNKVMRRVARRDLVSWDADARGYRMDPADAEIVLQRWPAP